MNRPFVTLTKILLFIIIGTCHLEMNAQTNEGTDFWFGFMEHRDIGSNTMVAMVTSKYNTNGSVSIPNLGWEQTFSLTANDVTLITLPSSAEVLGSESKSNQGIHLLADLPVSVYIHQYHQARSEASVVLPVVSLGNEYYTITYTGIQAQGTTYPAEFLIVASEDETLVTITVSDDTKQGKTPGTTFDVILNQGETYQVQAATSQGDLTGSYIIADKKIAVFAGNRWTQVPSNCSARDNLLEQMYPVSTWGKKFVTVPNANMPYDVFRILASENNTSIVINGNPSYNLNAGEFVEYQQANATYIESSEPILIAQFIIGQNCSSNSVGDPSMVLLNSIEQTRDTVTLFNSSLENITQNYINIIMATSDAPFVEFDGQLIDGNYPIQTVGLNDEYSYARLSVGTGSHTIISDGCGIIATAYGYGNVESYAYSGGASFKNINFNPIPEGGCLNDTVFFDTGLSPLNYNFFWDLGDGNTSTEATFSHFYPDLGTYPVSLIIDDLCLGTTDTLYQDLLISLRESVASLSDVLICQGESFSLGATDIDNAVYEWTGPSNYFSEEQFPTILDGHPNMSGDYSVIGIVSGCATFPVSTHVEVIPTPNPNLGPDTIFCTRDYTTILNPGSFLNYQWHNGATSTTLPVLEDGIYSVEVSDSYGCIGTDSVFLREICPTRIYVPNIFTPDGDGHNDFFKAYAFDVIDFKLSVFSRWGELVFQSTNPEESWNGQYKNKWIQSGIYVWQLEVTGYQENGTIYSEVLNGSLTVVY